ncbi:hypothetical protein ABZP36_010850 [Zizania latifolia]
MGFVVEQEFKAFPIAGKVRSTNNTMPVDWSRRRQILTGRAIRRPASPPRRVRGCGGEDEVVDLEVKVPARWERRLDLMSDKTFLTPRLQGVQLSHQDLNLPPPAAARQTKKERGVRGYFLSTLWQRSPSFPMLNKESGKILM